MLPSVSILRPKRRRRSRCRFSARSSRCDEAARRLLFPTVRVRAVAAMRKITGVIFSDLGQASSFMKLDWVQRALEKSLGFAAFPATLNVRPKTPEDAQAWQTVQKKPNDMEVRLAVDRSGSAGRPRIEL